MKAAPSAETIAKVIAEEPCRICNAKRGERCGSIIDASQYLDVPHYARLEAGRTATP